MRKAIVTGASGHIGFHVAKELLNNNYHVDLLVRNENLNISELRQRGAVVHRCDLFDPSTYAGILEEADVLFHLAAENTTSVQNREKIIRGTFDLTKVVIRAALDAKIKTIIYTSSVVVLGRSHNKAKLINENDIISTPESPYVEGKLRAEHFVEQLIVSNHHDIRRVYPSWVVGPGDTGLTPPHKIIRNFVEKGGRFYFEGGISIAEVSDIARGHINAYELGKPGGKYILGGDNISFLQFYELLSGFAHKKKPGIKIPKWIIYLAAIIISRILRLFKKEFPISPGYVKSVIGNYSWYDSRKAIEEINYKVTPAQIILEEAVRDARRRIAGVIDLGRKKQPVYDPIQSVSSPKPESANEGVLLITGVPGWLGNRMVDMLINGDRFGRFKSDRKICLFVEPRFKGLLQLPENYKIVYGDLNNRKDIEEALESVTTVFHLAGAIYPKQVNTLYKVNTYGTKNLVDACMAKNIRRIIYMGTDSICGHGDTKNPCFSGQQPARPYKNYGKSKYLAEKYLLDMTKDGKIDGTSLRGFWFFGPFAPARQLNFIKMFSWPRQIVFGNGKNYRSISHIDNVIQAFFKSEKNVLTYGKWYWIGNDLPNITVDHIYETIARTMNVGYHPLYVPRLFCRGLELTDTLLGKFNYINATIQAAGKFDYHICGSIENAKNDFGYHPDTGLEDAAKELAEIFNKMK